MCSSFGLLPIVLEWGAGLGSSSRRCECDDASRRLSFCCTHANVSFFSAREASISRLVTFGCPPFASCIFHILISCSITRSSCIISRMCHPKLSDSTIGLSCSGGMLRGSLVVGLVGGSCLVVSLGLTTLCGIESA